MVNKTARTLLLGSLICLLFLSSYNVNSFTVRLPNQKNRIAFLIAATPGDEISLTYRHSVEKTLVKGIFQISPPSILAKETWMTSVGTGLPNTFSKRTRREGKWIVVDEGLTKIENFRFFISEVNNSQITTPSGDIDLMKFPSGTVILLAAEKISLLHHCFYRIKNLING